MSPTGLSIETVKWMKPGEWIFVNTRLGLRKIGIPGEVRWIRQVASTRIGNHLTPVYHVGIAVFREDVQPEWNELVEECTAERTPGVEATLPVQESQPSPSPAWDATVEDGSSD